MKIFLSILIFLAFVGQERTDKCIGNKVGINNQVLIEILNNSVLGLYNGVLDEQETNDFGGSQLYSIQIGQTAFELIHTVDITDIISKPLHNKFLQYTLIDLPPPQIS